MHKSVTQQTRITYYSQKTFKNIWTLTAQPTLISVHYNTLQWINEWLYVSVVVFPTWLYVVIIIRWITWYFRHPETLYRNCVCWAGFENLIMRFDILVAGVCLRWLTSFCYANWPRYGISIRKEIYPQRSSCKELHVSFIIHHLENCPKHPN